MIIAQAVFYTRVLALFAWLMIVCFIGICIGLIKFKHPNNNHIIGHKIWGPVARKISGVKIQKIDFENLYKNTPCIYAANHQSALDVVIFGGLCPRNTVVIAKRELIWVPLFGWFFYFAGNVFLRRKKKDHSINALDGAVQEVKNKGASIFIFPEGTRNLTNEKLLPFKKGAFHMAMQANVPIVPLVVPRYNHLASSKNKTLNIGEIPFKVLDPIWPSENIDEFMLRVRSAMEKAME